MDSFLSIQGEVVSVVYENPENGYVIARLLVPSEPGQTTVVGVLGSVAPGESLRLTGEWTEHPKFGRQFKAETCEHVLPAFLNGIRRFLKSEKFFQIHTNQVQRRNS